MVVTGVLQSVSACHPFLSLSHANVYARAGGLCGYVMCHSRRVVRVCEETYV